MPDLTQPQGPQPPRRQDQQHGQPQRQDREDSPFGGVNRDKRLFKILPLSPNEENVSYDVIVTENQEGDIITERINKRFISAGVEISHTTVPIGRCERCSEVNLDSVFSLCGVCGRRACAKCVRAFWTKNYCRWRCFSIAVITWLVKLLFRIIFQTVLFFIRFILKVLSIPVRDILKG